MRFFTFSVFEDVLPHSHNILFMGVIILRLIDDDAY